MMMPTMLSITPPYLFLSLWTSLCLGINPEPACLAFSGTLPVANRIQSSLTHQPSEQSRLAEFLSGEWTRAKQALRNPRCCVVSVSGLENQLSILQQYFCGDNAPSDLDLRMRVRCGLNKEKNTSGDDSSLTYSDCSIIYNAIMEPSSAKNTINLKATKYNNKNVPSSTDHPCILALEELARGVASLADGPLEATCTDVHLRVVCASRYEAIDPMFHTDKCPLRGYVTLTGPGTEYMEETCLPWEYAALRSFGVDGLSAVGGGKNGKVKHLKMAKELEFIVMKGDYYKAKLSYDATYSITESIIEKLWNRSSACVHRSPPGGERGTRRVIVSLDLADGLDDQEWYEISRRRGWRSGMTQRKSKLVS